MGEGAYTPLPWLRSLLKDIGQDALPSIYFRIITQLLYFFATVGKHLTFLTVVKTIMFQICYVVSELIYLSFA